MQNKTAQKSLDKAIAGLTAIYHGDLANLSFPGVDAATLDAAVAAVAAERSEVDRLQREHQEALAALGTAQQALADHARQALAYARVFASGKPELNAELDAIVLDAPAPPAPKKRRVRRSKSTALAAAPQLVLDSTPAPIPESRTAAPEIAPDNSEAA